MNQKRPKSRLKLTFGLSAFALGLAIFGFQQVQASSTVTAAGDAEGFCTSTVAATNGAATVVRSGAYCILTFKTIDGASGNATTATFTWTPPSWIASATTAEYLVVGGGASGNRGICGIYWGQGGGGGGVATGSANFSGATAVTVGAGGAGAGIPCKNSSPGDYGNNGQNSVLSSIAATGGRTGNNTTVGNAGSFGGTSGYPTSTNPSTGNSGGQGAATGASGCPTDCQVGGGGGAGGAGNVMNGGPGITSSISGASVIYGSGGGGRQSSLYGSTTDGGGTAPSNTNGKQHQGGGGADYGTGWGAGGSGIVIVKYSIPPIPTANTSTAIVLVDPRAETIRIPLIQVTSYWNNRACVTLANSGGNLDITDADTTEYKVEVVGSSGASGTADNAKNLRISGTSAQMNSLFNPAGESKSYIQIKRPTTGSNTTFNESLTLTIKSDNSNATACTSAPSNTLLTATIKPYGIDINQKNEVTIN